MSESGRAAHRDTYEGLNRRRWMHFEGTDHETPKRKSEEAG